jgi:hypothetical protein
MKFYLLVVLILFISGAAAAQTRPANPAQRPTTSPRMPTRVEPQSRGGDMQINLPEEMRVRMEIERAEGEHRKILEYVGKLSDLSAEVSSKFREGGKLSEAEVKKLSAIEKLAKRILSHAGGSEVDEDAGRQSVSVAEAIEQLSAAADKIKKEMTAETRFVVSASVIASSNDIINLAQLIRRVQKQNH